VRLAGFSRVSNSQKTPLATIGNRFLDSAKWAAVIGLCHADTSFGPGAIESFAGTAHAGAIAGIVGIDSDRVYRWSKDNPGQVSTLDSCAVFLRRDLGLRFDETVFDGMHCHVEDLCLQASRAGIPVIVPPAEADHVGARTLIAEWQSDYRLYRDKLSEKWAGVEFETT
jgi:hypothetical protein